MLQTQHNHAATHQRLSSHAAQGPAMKLTPALLQEATAQGVLTPAQADQLWQFLQQRQQVTASFNASHILYYVGGLLAIGAMSVFMNLGFERYGGSGIVVIGLCYALLGVALTERFRKRAEWTIPAGICATFVLSLTPLIVYGLQQALGYWQSETHYQDYHHYIDWRWLLMEKATLVVGAVLLWRYKLAFLMMPIAVTLWYLSMDLTPFLFQQQDEMWQLRKWVSLWFGVVVIGLAIMVDIRTRSPQDYAFWLYLAGVLAFWGGLTSMDSSHELGKFIYFLINLGLLLLGAILVRRVFAVFAAFGIVAYLSHLAYDVFKDSMLFPVVLTVIGFAVIYAGLCWQRHQARLSTTLRSYLPPSIQQMLARRS